MKFFIDTANLDQIQQAKELGVLDGVTTNPSLMAKEGIKGDAAILAHYKKICQLVSSMLGRKAHNISIYILLSQGANGIKKRRLSF